MSIKSAFICIFLIIPCISFGQSTIEGLAEQLDHYASKHPREKVHVHVDKDSYAAGENIWMKLYCIVSPLNMLTQISKVAYIDLVSPSNEVIKTIKIPLTSGLGIGDFQLTDSIVEGSYHIRAYTQWMRNDSTAYFFNKTIQVYNGRSDDIMSADQIITENGKKYYAIDLKTFSGTALNNTSVSYKIVHTNGKESSGKEKTSATGRILIELKDEVPGNLVNLNFKSFNEQIIHKTFTIPEEKTKHSLQILPEAGVIIDQIDSKIGFKALNSKGLGEQASIKIIENGQEEIASFETNKLGMTSFPFILRADHQYVALATFQDGSQTQVPFPPIQQSGIAMSVSNLVDDKIFVQINASSDQINNNEIYIIAQYQGNIFHVVKQKLSKNEVLFSIPRKNLPVGVIQISLLNNSLSPLLERMIFNYRPEKILQILTKTDQESYGLRQKVHVDIETALSEDTLRVSSLSAAVVNSQKTKLDGLPSNSIFSSLLLSSEINGFIESPQYYFQEEEGIKKSELDDLMLIQGWRKLDWSTYTKVSDLPKFNFETGASVSGTIKKLGRKALVPNATVSLIPSTNYLGGIDTLTNAEGRFVFDELMFPDSVKFIVTAKTDKEKNRLDIELDKSDNISEFTYKNSPEVINDVNSKYLGNIKNAQAYFAQLEQAGLMQKTIKIQEVQVTRTAQNKASKRSNNLNGAGRADQVIGAEDLDMCSSLEICLSGRLMGVTFQNGIPYNTRGNVPMQVVLDGMYIEADQISMINIMDVESIEVLRNSNYTTIYGQYGSNGLIIITSKSGNGLSKAFNPTGIVTFIPKGFHLNKSFFKPTYEADEQTKLSLDLRSTIHWEPNIIIDQTGKSSFEFYTSDEKGPYKLIIEGVDFNGKIGRKEIEINVTD